MIHSHRLKSLPILLALSYSTFNAPAQSPVQPPAQPDNESIIKAQHAIDQGDDPSDDFWTGLLDVSRYTFRDITFYWDNDGTTPGVIKDSDRYYTNGMAIELSFNPNFSPAMANRFAPPDQWDNPRFGVGIAIKQRIYTPADISLTNPPARDHPYGGYLALGFTLQRADNNTHDNFTLDLGIVGPGSASESIQKWIHSTFPEEIDPKGWETQIPTEPTINFAFTRTWKSDKANIAGIELEMLPTLGFDLGNVLISARSSMTLRIGKNLPTDFGPPNMLTQKDHTVRASQSSDASWSIYAFSRLGVDVIARDMFLDGPIFTSSRSAKREPFVATFSFGFMARYKSVYIGWAQHIQTERFELQPDGQTWGSIILGCSFDF